MSGVLENDSIVAAVCLWGAACLASFMVIYIYVVLPLVTGIVMRFSVRAKALVLEGMLEKHAPVFAKSGRDDWVAIAFYENKFRKEKQNKSWTYHGFLFVSVFVLLGVWSGDALCLMGANMIYPWFVCLVLLTTMALSATFFSRQFHRVWCAKRLHAYFAELNDGDSLNP